MLGCKAEGLTSLKPNITFTYMESAKKVSLEPWTRSYKNTCNLNLICVGIAAI